MKTQGKAFSAVLTLKRGNPAWKQEAEDPRGGRECGVTSGLVITMVTNLTIEMEPSTSKVVEVGKLRGKIISKGGKHM